ncbi:MAG: hypothetical protein HQ481_14625 [Alphaproteobacteria bacterium]|nr:hypothetical protein [Alphaproteobacteria bacterium]
MEDHQIQFYMEEYRSLRSEIEYRMKAAERIEYASGVAIFMIYAWFSQREIPYIFWWIPVAVPLLGIVRQIGLLIRTMQIADYVRQIEAKICTESPSGWEHFLREKRLSPTGYPVSVSGYAIWGFLLVGTTAIALNGGLSLPL